MPNNRSLSHSAHLPERSCADPPKPVSAATGASPPARRAPRDTALRRRRLQLAQQLKTIAQLQEQANELRAEISSLESIIGAQADAIDALSRQNQEPED